MTQANMFDRLAGLANRDEAMKRVEEHAEPDWLTIALATAFAVAERLQYLATDDMWEAGLAKTRENRALGPVMVAACRRGWIVKVEGQMRKSKCKWQNGRPLQLYRSLIWRAA